MASKISKKVDDWQGRRVNFHAFVAEIEKRREILGQPELPRNSGERRTESKKALLAAIKDAGGKW